MFQFMFHSVRSMTASSARWARALPNASAAGAVHRPVAATGLVIPLIVRSPVTLAAPVLSMASAVETNLTSGWLATSKNSDERTCARNCSGVRIEIESTFAVPSRRPWRSPASTWVRLPRKIETP